MRIESIGLADLTDGEVRRWHDLAAAAAMPNPFYEPGYALPLARNLGQAREVALLVAAEGGDWHACLPIHATSGWHRVPLSCAASWHGHVLYGLLGTPLYRPERAEEALAALLGEMTARAPGAGFAALDLLADDVRFEPQLAAGEYSRSAPIRFESFERAMVRRRPEPTYLEKRLSPKHRRELRRQRRRLGDVLDGEPELVELSGEDAAYERLIAFEAAAKAARGTVLSSDPAHAAFFLEMCRSFAASGRLQLLELRCGNRTVATKCNIVAGNTAFMLKIAYDKEWAALSPGILMEVENLKYFHDRTDVELMDSCADPNNAMINRLWPDRRTISSYALPAPGAAAPLVGVALRAARSLRDRKRERKGP